MPKLAELVEHPERVSSVPLEAVPAMRGKLAEIDTLLLGRLLQSSNGQGKTLPERDRLLDARETAARLGMSLDSSTSTRTSSRSQSKKVAACCFPSAVWSSTCVEK